MELSITDKKKIVQFVAVVGIICLGVYFFKPKSRKSLKPNNEAMLELPATEREFMEPPMVDEQSLGTNPKSDNAHAALTAYINAYNAGAPQEEIDALNKEFSNELGVQVIRRRSDNKLVVKDLNDQPIMVYPSVA